MIAATRSVALLVALLCGGASPAAEDGPGHGGKLLLTAGVGQVEGAAGGGLTPWALIGGYGSEGQIGGSAFVTHVALTDYGLDIGGLQVGIDDRFEFSLARQRFDTDAVGVALGLGRGFLLEQDIVGAKFRIAGDAVLEPDRWLPQIAIGLQHKRHRQGDVVRAIGARSISGTDLYLSATKLLLAQGLLLNGTLRYTRANQFGLLGFGGDRRSSASPQLEASVAVLLSRRLALGAEYRSKPDNLGIAGEDAAWDLFLAWTPTRQLSLTLALVDLGAIVVAEAPTRCLSVAAGRLLRSVPMIRHLLFALLLATVFPATARADDVPNPAPAYPELRPVLDEFGGVEGLTALIDDFMVILLEDPRTLPFFAESEHDRVKRQLVEQFCVILGGNCLYSGRSMVEAHQGQGIRRADFNALVENLQLAMERRDIPFRAQNRLLAKLAPMHREVIQR